MTMILARCPDCGRGFAHRDAVERHRRDTHLQPAWRAKQAAKAAKHEMRLAGQPAKKAHDAQPLGSTLDLVCGRCGSRPAFSTGRFGLKAECCGLWSWNGKPLVDGGTHAARIRAHEAFDRIWKGGLAARSRAYAALATVMGMTRQDCHISLMTAEQCRRVVAVVAAGMIEAELRRHEKARATTA